MALNRLLPGAVPPNGPPGTAPHPSPPSVPQKRGSAANIAQLTNAFSNASSLLSTGGQRENDHRLVKVARSMIDEDTLSELEAMFTSMDTTGDGQLTREDFVAQVGIGRMQEQANNFWRLMTEWYDVNHDGVITPAEFVSSFVSAALLVPRRLQFPASQVVPASSGGVAINVKTGDLLSEFEDHFRESLRDLMVTCQEGLHLEKQAGRRLPGMSDAG